MVEIPTPAGGYTEFSVDVQTLTIIEARERIEKDNKDEPLKQVSCNVCDDGKEEGSSFCLTCQIYMCDLHDESHRKAGSTKTHLIVTVNEAPSYKVNEMCEFHRKPYVEFCITCRRVICKTCSDTKPHDTHKKQDLSDAMDQNMSSFRMALDAGREHHLRLQTQQVAGVTANDNLLKRVGIVKLEVSSYFMELEKRLHNRQSHLIGELTQASNRLSLYLNAQSARVQSAAENLKKNCEDLNGILSSSSSTASPTTLVQKLQMALKLSSELQNTSEMRVDDFTADMDVKFLKDSKLDASLDSAGKLQLPESKQEARK